MADLKIKSLFIEFLHDRDAYALFAEAVAKATKDFSVPIAFSIFLNKHIKEPYELIRIAFSWRDTPQGFFYWLELYTAWGEKLINEDIKCKSIW